MSESELKNCPFCGGKATFYGFTVCCDKCGVQMTANVETIKKPTYKDGKASTIPKWNIRAKDPEKKALIADKEYLLDFIQRVYGNREGAEAALKSARVNE